MRELIGLTELVVVIKECMAIALTLLRDLGDGALRGYHVEDLERLAAAAIVPRIAVHLLRAVADEECLFTDRPLRVLRAAEVLESLPDPGVELADGAVVIRVGGGAE